MLTDVGVSVSLSQLVEDHHLIVVLLLDGLGSVVVAVLLAGDVDDLDRVLLMGVAADAQSHRAAHTPVVPKRQITFIGRSLIVCEYICCTLTIKHHLIQIYRSQQKEINVYLLINMSHEILNNVALGTIKWDKY